MEESGVIDIDDLLGSATSVGQQEAEEYDFENFSNDEDSALQSTSAAKVSDPQSSSNSAAQDGVVDRDVSVVNHHAKRATRKSSLEDDFKKLFLSSKSSKKKSPDVASDPSRVNSITPEKGIHVVDVDERDGEYMDARVTQNEALVDAFIQGELSDAVLSEEELCIDVNSEELRQFILEFEEDAPTNPSEISAAGNRNQKQAIILINHRLPPSDDQDSLNSSISTTESRDGSLTSSLASSDLSPIRTKHKVPRGKSVRFLMSNLLRNNKAQHHHNASRTSGSEEESKEAKRILNRPPKEKNKKREKEEKERDKISKQHSKSSKMLQSNSAPSSSKSVARLAPGGRPGDRVPDSNAQPRSQFSNVTVATPLSPGGRDNTLHKQLIQAAARGDQQVLEFLLTANEGLSEVRDSRGNTLLHAVARRGHVDCLAWLAAGPCSGLLSVENDDCFTATALAVKHGQVGCVKCLAQHPGASPELQAQDHRWSLLHLAARFGQETCLRWLLEHMQMQDISLDQTDHNNNTPAHLAAKYGHLHCLQTLVEFNADVTLLNKKKQSPCTLAARYHHDLCAQFLVVVETCIKLSAELTVTQRKLRESQQEKDALSKKLREAMSCTDALVHMQRTDLSQRIEQVQGEYVDLTNLLVRQLDQMHRHQSGGHSPEAVPVSREDMLVSKQKAGQLQQTCAELLILDQQHQEGCNEAQLQEIERRLRRLQPLPTSPIWPSIQGEVCGGLALDSMRARLSEVKQEMSSLNHPSPSLASDNLDTLSLSSSYASSLSSSSSSLQTGMVQSPPSTLSKKHRASWNEELPNGVPMEDEGTASTHESKTQSTGRTLAETRVPDLGDSSTNTQGQRLGASHHPEFGTRDDLSVQYSKGDSTSPNQSVIRDSGPSQTKPNALLVKASIEHWETGARDELKMSQDTRSPLKTDQRECCAPVGEVTGRSVTSPPSYEESCTRLSRNSPRVEASRPAEDTAKRKPEHAARNPGEMQNAVNQTDLKSTQSRTVFSSKDELETPEPYLLPSFDKSQQNLDSYHQYSAKHFTPQQKHCQQALPGFMRKVQPTNEFGEPESGKVVVKISNREEMVLQPPSQTATNQSSTSSSHQRASSNSSLSSMSSDIPWSESDPDESPRPNRHPHRGGILSKKSSDGAKKSQDKHITFALDHEEAKPSVAAPPTGGKAQPNKRRDLSPIYEAPDLVKSTKDDSKTLSRVDPATDKKDIKPQIQTAKDPKDSDAKSSAKRRNFRLFSYSSDEGDHEIQKEQTTQKTSPGSEPKNLKYPDGLTDVVSVEFNGIGSSDDNGVCSKDDADDRLWYESSEDEEDQDNVHISSSSGGFERHICYL